MLKDCYLSEILHHKDFISLSLEMCGAMVGGIKNFNAEGKDRPASVTPVSPETQAYIPRGSKGHPHQHYPVIRIQSARAVPMSPPTPLP